MKKGQVQAMEIIVVVIVLILLIIIGLFVFTSLNQDVAEAQSRDFIREETLALATRLSSIPELSCPQKGGDDSVCIDVLKANILGEWLTNPDNPNYDDITRLYYTQYFGESTITLVQVYPYTPNERTLLFDGLFEENFLVQEIPVVLYDPAAESYALGKIEVRS